MWLVLAGRGWGKTRTGAEDQAYYALTHPGSRLAVVAPTYTDARDTCVEGDSGLLRVIPAPLVTDWNRSLGELILANKSRFKLFSAEEPDRLRGPQHHRAWGDEVAAWKRSESSKAPDALDQLLFGLRLGERPRLVLTTTPRPAQFLVDLIARGDVVITKGSTFENAANLAPAALASLRERYSGTRLGRQELEAELLDDIPGALWTHAHLDALRVPTAPEGLRRTVIAVDPSGSASGDEVGIIVAAKGSDEHGYVLADRSGRFSPDGWARAAVNAYHEFRADLIVAEANFGGDMVEHTLRTVDARIPYKKVTASRGKHVRAEPVAALTEQGKAHMVGSLPHLEDQLCATTANGYEGSGSPDRMDAYVWALTELLLESQWDWGLVA